MTTMTASESPFKAGETEVTGTLLSVDFCGKTDLGVPATRVTFEIPADTAGWSSGRYVIQPKAMAREAHGCIHYGCPICAGTPTPPAADDLAAARAEIEKLRRALQSIKREDWCWGRDSQDRVIPKRGRCGKIARAALLPSPPDAKPAPERERMKGWINIYPPAWHDTKEAADRQAGLDRIACIDLSQHFVGEGLEP